MSENIFRIENSTKEEQYKNLLPQLESLLAGETDIIANMANLSAALKSVFDFFWVGFYIVRNDSLVLGPFQGSIACTRIRFGRGVCGTAWKEARAVVVPDVNAFPGHIACSSLSQSEIVIPLIHEGKIWAVLDVDSDRLNEFDEVDQLYLEQAVALMNDSWTVNPGCNEK